MKIIILLLVALTFSQCSVSQIKDSVLNYPVVIKFQSKCCGVPEQKPLDSAILLYKINNHIRIIKADKISPMGREGEYYLGFKNSAFLLKHKKTFIAMLRTMCKKMKDPGYVELEEDFIIRKSDLPSSVEIKGIVF